MTSFSEGRADRRLAEAMRALDPAPAQLARVEQAVLVAVDARSPSLVREWLDLVRARPAAHSALAMAAAVALVAATPIGTLAWLVMRLVAPA